MIVNNIRDRICQLYVYYWRLPETVSAASSEWETLRKVC